jgi:hypothetical protein
MTDTQALAEQLTAYEAAISEEQFFEVTARF